jgi:hypothetical protein
MKDVTMPAGTASLPAVSKVGGDFPGWVPPMLVKELRQGLRQRGFVGGLVAAQAVLVILFITGFVTDVGNGSQMGRTIDSFFWGTLFATVLVLTPLRAMGALSAEIEARTMDLLLLTRLNAWRIVWGKWVSLMVQSLLLVVALLPYGVVRYFLGSVNLVSDLKTITVMLGAGGALTALGLWLSGVHRGIRILIVVGVLYASFGAASGFRGYSSIVEQIFDPSYSGGLSGVYVVFICTGWFGGCVLLWSLTMAVRWFAPMAENHAIGPRLMPLAFALPIAFLVGINMDLAKFYLFFWLCVATAIAAGEIANGRELMTIHLRGGLGRVRGLGAAFLPGWPSAALWAAGLTALVTAGWGAADMISTANLNFGDVPWLAVLAWTGLVFPVLLVSLVPTLKRQAGLLYFGLQVILGLTGVMAGSSNVGHSSSQWAQLFDWISHAVPGTSFWYALYELKEPGDTPGLVFAQLLGVVLTLVMMLWAAKPYWINVRLMRVMAAPKFDRKG